MKVLIFFYVFLGWPHTLSLRVKPQPNQPLCHRVSILLHSETGLRSVMLEYSSESSTDLEEVILTEDPISKHKWRVVHRLCNLTHSTLYWVRVAGANSFGYSPLGTQYNFTTDSEPMVKLAMASSATYSMATPYVIICVCLFSL